VDGFCLRDEVGAIIDTWPDFDGANAGYYTAMAAQVLLAEVFSRGRVS
jgi:hypothetical protein